MEVLVTGAGGFSGRHVLQAIAEADHNPLGLLRRPLQDFPCATADGDLLDPASIRPLVAGKAAVIHLAAFNPQRFSRAASDIGAMRKLNVDATRNLALMARDAGIIRFIFVSSVRVYGDGCDEPFLETDPVNPRDPYAQSKAEAEVALEQVFADKRDSLVILRPPVIYGPGRGGWIGLAARLARRGWLLPNPIADARKSVLSVGNFASAMVAALESGAHGVFNIADDGETSLAAIGKMLATHGNTVGTPRALPAIRASWMDRVPFLGDSLHHARLPCLIDTHAFQAAADWQPPESTADAIAIAYART